MAVCAGLLIGDIGAKHGMSAETRQYVDAFWKLIDEILNAVLFLMIGVEVFAVAFGMDAVTAGLLAIALALVARLAAVAVPVLLLAPFRDFSRGVIPIMTWGGLKGGISVALALSPARGRVETADPDLHLHGGAVLDHRPGPDRGSAGQTHRART